MASRTLVATLSSLALVAASFVIGYAFYFDYKRRKDRTLRKRIKEEKMIEAKKEKRKPTKLDRKKDQTTGSSPNIALSSSAIIEMIPEMALSLEDIYAKPPSERERIFYSLLVKGEELLSFKAEGSNLSKSYTEAAVQLFFKAIKMIPNPTELLISFQQVLPKYVFNSLTKLIAEDGLKKIVAYFNSIIPKNAPLMISPKKITLANGEVEQTWAIFATSDIMDGSIIYEEKPDASSLFLKYATSKEFCDFCLKQISNLSFVECKKCLSTCYCSDFCLLSAKNSHHATLCSNEFVPKLYEVSKEEHSEYSLLVARYLSALCSEESRLKEMRERNVKAKESDIPISSHFEFMKPLLLPILPSDEIVASVIKNIFFTTSPDIVEHLDDRRYSSIKGTLLFNVIGIPHPEIQSQDEQSPYEHQEQSPDNIREEKTPMSSSEDKENSAFVSNNEHSPTRETICSESSFSSPLIIESPVVDDMTVHEELSSSIDSRIFVNDLLEHSRSTLPKSKLIGHGIYHLSAHLQHSCDPNAQFVFPFSNHVLQLIASRKIEKGDEICVSYLPLTVGSTAAARKSMLKSTYHIDCNCPLCEADLSLN